MRGQVEHAGHLAVNVADGRGGAVHHLHAAKKMLGTQHHAGLAGVRCEARRVGAYAVFAKVAAHAACQRISSFDDFAKRMIGARSPRGVRPIEYSASAIACFVRLLSVVLERKRARASLARRSRRVSAPS